MLHGWVADGNVSRILQRWCMRYVHLIVLGLSLLTIVPDCYAAFGLSGGSGPDSIAAVLDRVFSMMTGKIARSIAAIAIVGCGYMAFLGKLSWSVIINFSVAIGLIFGASSIAQWLIG